MVTKHKWSSTKQLLSKEVTTRFWLIRLKVDLLKIVGMDEIGNKILHTDLLKQEECDKAKVAMQIEALMKKKEQIETSTNDEAEKMKQAAEADLQKHKEEIIRLKHKISELKLQLGKSKKAGVKVGYGENPPRLTTRLPVFEDLGAGRECVMCMTEEIYVVFLPCAHQVVCEDCPLQEDDTKADHCRLSFIEMHFLDPVKFGRLDDFQEEFKDINQGEQISGLHKMLVPHLMRSMDET